jgi:hypothetical protein
MNIHDFVVKPCRRSLTTPLRRNSHLLSTHCYQFHELGDSVEGPTHARHWDPNITARTLGAAGAWFHRVLGAGWIHVCVGPHRRRPRQVRPDHMNLYRVAQTPVPSWRGATINTSP